MKLILQIGVVFGICLIGQTISVFLPIAVPGVAIGTCSHTVGTSKAITIGEVEGAMSGIALGQAGILTVIITLVRKIQR
jgi:putative effector of murein hydrolase